MKRMYVNLKKAIRQAQNFVYIKRHLKRIKADLNPTGGEVEIYINGNGVKIIDLVEDLVKEE